MIRVSSCLFLSLLGTGCGGRINQDEAERLFRSTWGLVGAARDAIYDGMDGDPAEGLGLVAQERGYTVDGTLSSGEGWSGVLGLSGEITLEEGAERWALDLTLGGLSWTAEAVVLDGSLHVDLDAEDGTTSAWSQVTGISGELEATGEAKGTATVDYVVSVQLDDQGEYSYAASGAVGDYDLSGAGDGSL